MGGAASIFHLSALRGSTRLEAEAYYLKDWQGYDMRPHSHNRMEIMYVVSGKCSIALAGGEMALKKGEFILLDAGVPHGLTVPQAAPCRMMNIEFSVAEGAALPLGETAARCPELQRFVSKPAAHFVFSDSEDVCSVLRRVIHCLDEGAAARGYELELLTTELLLLLARLAAEQNAPQAGQAALRRAMQFIRQNYFRDITVQDVCACAGVSQGYLGRLFRSHAGTTVVGYLADVRVKKAKLLLEKTELPAADISAYVGTSSRAYFNQLFKARTGLTPGEYRRARQRALSEKGMD